MGRSFDSQLGNRLQKTSMFLARKKFSFTNVPNYVFLLHYENNKKLKMFLLSIPNNWEINNLITTKCYKIETKADIMNKLAKLIEERKKII